MFTALPEIHPFLKEKMTFAGDIQVGSWQHLKVSEDYMFL